LARKTVLLKPGEILESGAEKLGVGSFGAGNCARYARLAAQKLFGKQYSRANAWDFHRKNKAAWADGTGTGDWRGHAEPGAILAIYNPESPYNVEGREWTHLAVYAGEHRRKAVIVHQPGGNPKSEYLHDYLARIGGGKVKAVFKPPVLPPTTHGAQKPLRFRRQRSWVRERRCNGGPRGNNGRVRQKH
jgi:hypothetical protein